MAISQTAVSQRWESTSVIPGEELRVVAEHKSRGKSKEDRSWKIIIFFKTKLM